MQILKVIISSIGKKKGLLLDTVGFMCCTVSITATQLYHSNAKLAIDNL